MARYSKIERRIWNDNKFDTLTDDGKLMFFFLLTHPHLTAVGALRASPAGLASELRWPTERFNKALEEAFLKGMVKYDESNVLVWLPQFLKYNQPESPNVVKSWGQSLDYLPECALKNELMQHVKDFISTLPQSFQEALPQAFLKLCSSFPKKVLEAEEITEETAVIPTEAVTKVVVEKTQDATPARPREQDPPEILDVFNFWKETFKHSHAVLDKNRRKFIRQALGSGYTVDQLCVAITGCSRTPHNIGQNDRGQRYDGLHVILRDADQIDRFICNAQEPPRLQNTADQLLQSNISVSKNWLQKKMLEFKATAQEPDPHAKH